MANKEINSRVRQIADEYKPKMVIDEATGNNSLVDDNAAEDVFSKFLPEAYSMENVRELHELMLDFSAGQTLAHGELSQEVMQKNAELKHTHLKSKVGFTSYETSYKRETSGVVKDKPWTNYGVAKTDMLVGTGRKAAHYKDVLEYLSQEAGKVFSN